MSLPSQDTLLAELFRRMQANVADTVHSCENEIKEPIPNDSGDISEARDNVASGDNVVLGDRGAKLQRVASVIDQEIAWEVLVELVENQRKLCTAFLTLLKHS